MPLAFTRLSLSVVAGSCATLMSCFGGVESMSRRFQRCEGGMPMALYLPGWSSVHPLAIHGMCPLFELGFDDFVPRA